jgi:hypothetical protein
VAGSAISLSVNLVGNKYNDQTLAGWADQVAKQNGLSGACLAFLNPQGVLNTDADASQGSSDTTASRRAGRRTFS